jgi:hypothetical protein
MNHLGFKTGRIGVAAIALKIAASLFAKGIVNNGFHKLNL